MIEFKEPYYLVEFNSSIVNFEIFINDIPAFIPPLPRESLRVALDNKKAFTIFDKKKK